MPPRRTLELQELRIDALLVSNLHNVRYLSGFTGSNALLAVAGVSATLFTDPRYDIQAEEQAGQSAQVKIAKGPLIEAALDLIRRKKWSRVGFERERISFDLFTRLKEGLPAGAKLVPVGPVIEQLRAVKTEEEIAAIRRSVIANSAAFDKAVAKIRPTMTEADLAAELEYRQRKAGAEKPSFETIVASGAHSALPHAEPRNHKLEAGAPLLIDMGALVDGYSSDMTRTLHMGKAKPMFRRMYDAVLEAQLAGIDAIRPGAAAGKVDAAARRVLAGHGMDGLFIHSTGHGLGLEIHEAPRIGKKDRTPLAAGMVITVEPGVYVEGFGGVRIEDTVLVTDRGAEVLTPTPKKFVQL